jgi:hypothetical protein
MSHPEKPTKLRKRRQSVCIHNRFSDPCLSMGIALAPNDFGPLGNMLLVSNVG